LYLPTVSYEEEEEREEKGFLINQGLSQCELDPFRWFEWVRVKPI